ncbi:MAG: Rne/Rng family ribonuclease [Caulobacter sp.]|nr:Rne/Rng family ribonuclease [Caulobacter sp.]
MTKKMLIDAAHAEETRVVVLDGNRIEEFDFESLNRKQLRGNIYLAKVTRVEPSLQAAFIEYGGNRHGFLAFNEIHPDYFQIPLADREALMREVAEEDDEPAPPKRGRGGDRGRGRGRAKPAAREDADAVLEDDDSAGEADTDSGETADEDGESHDDADHGSEDRGGRPRGTDDDDDMEEEVERRRRRLMRKYKIQDVIRRRQIMLVQVVKEERGNKGAALTTYLSLAGRYGVLMPNTDRGGGISRKIVSATDRKRLKTVVQSLDVPKGLGLIVRTAGAKRTKAEIKRDYEYLMRLWENIRETTLNSVAPALIYEEEDLVKRAIRDLFDKDIDSVQVEGEAGYKEARDFMRMIMPAQAKKVVAYRDPTPLFVAHRIESQLSQIYSPVVPLKSGGYLVINQTEALVAVDVNSGKATRERNIEATALKTNLEAAEETCRQLRLRDLAGLIVIDFIDMDESKNNRAVEKVLKDNLKDDRARVQMGRISSFGLMEISRQRRRTGVLEGTTHVCPHCEGVGRVRSVESSALSALRAVEMEALRGGGELTLKVPAAVGLYILNEKRSHLARIHQVHQLYVTIQIDDALAHADHELERTATGEHSLHPLDTAALALPGQVLVEDDDFVPPEEDEDDEEIIDDEEDEAESSAASDRSPRDEGRGDARGDSEGRNGRRRRRRGGRRDDADEAPATAGPASGDGEAFEADGDDDLDKDGRRRRRGRRGGRRSREEDRPRDGFAWARPRVPFGDDPFQWHDPATLEGGGMLATPGNLDHAVRPQLVESDEGPDRAPRPERGERPDREERGGRSRRARGGRGRREPVESTNEATDAAPAVAGSAEPPVVIAPEIPAELPATAAPDEVWVELTPEPEPVKKPRRARGRGKKADAEAEVVAEQPAADAIPAPAEPEAPAPAQADSAQVEAPQVEAAPEPAPQAQAEPEPAPAPAPVVPAEPDPAEITAPPAKPKRGWWRK